MRIRSGVACATAVGVCLALPAAASATADQVEAAAGGPFVTVGDAGNAADQATGFGAVSKKFRIAKYDVTIAQYVAFLRAVARKDPNGLYNKSMASDLTVAGIKRTKRGKYYHYRALRPAGPVQGEFATAGGRPITYVSWFDSARFVNWLCNGSPRGKQNSATTENGAYNLTSKAAKKGKAVPVNQTNPNTGKAPKYRLPTENQWYKAAYYDPDLNSGSGGYWPFATQSTSPPGNVIGGGLNINYNVGTLFSVTAEPGLLLTQQYLTDVGSFPGSPGPFDTFDMNGSVWEIIDGKGTASKTKVLRGGGWTSFFTYLRSDYRLGVTPQTNNSNGGFRLASNRVPSGTEPYELVSVGDPGNVADTTGYGAVDTTFSIGKYEVTIQQYSDFLNAVAKSDPYGLYATDMGSTTVLNSVGIGRTGDDGAYAYSPLVNAGSSANRPITFVSWFDAARFANWMSNGRPIGAAGPTTTEQGAYNLDGAVTGAAVAVNSVNPNTGAAPTYTIPNEDQWYKAAYFDPSRNSDGGGYWRYATRSNSRPGNTIGSTPNQVNFINDANRTFTYSATGFVSVDTGQNYLTDMGAFPGGPSHYGTLEQMGNVYQWNDLSGKKSVSRGLRGGFWFSGPPSVATGIYANVGTKREANDTGLRLAAR